MTDKPAERTPKKTDLMTEAERDASFDGGALYRDPERGEAMHRSGPDAGLRTTTTGDYR